MRTSLTKVLICIRHTISSSLPTGKGGTHLQHVLHRPSHALPHTRQGVRQGLHIALGVSGGV